MLDVGALHRRTVIGHMLEVVDRLQALRITTHTLFLLGWFAATTIE